MPYKEPEKWREANRKSYWKHRDERLEHNREYNKNHPRKPRDPAKAKAAQKRYYLRHREDILAKCHEIAMRPETKARRHDAYLKRTEGVVKNRLRPRGSAEAKESIRRYSIKYGRIKTAWIKFVVFNYYSNGTMTCACPDCGVKGLKFLSMDHVNGHGDKHRKELRLIGGSEMYKWLLRMGFPEGYQVLCHNCNQAKGRWGICPHEARRRRLAASNA